jgi:hypothetical protein
MAREMLAEGCNPTQESAMPAIKYRVTLSDEEVEMLEALLRQGKSAARKRYAVAPC